MTTQLLSFDIAKYVGRAVFFNVSLQILWNEWGKSQGLKFSESVTVVHAKIKFLLLCVYSLELGAGPKPAGLLR